jgi:KaiC/GvpD/RAD55 family RecA-like ATPase
LNGSVLGEMNQEADTPIVYPRVTSGVDGLDAMVNGGLPKGRIVLIRGPPGMGKTILCGQFLYKGAKNGEKGLFVSLEETREQLIRELYLVGMDFRRLERDGLVTFLDASPVRHIPAEVKLGNISVGKRDFSLLALAKKIKNIAEANKIERIVVDPLTALTIQYPEDGERRLMVLDLLEVLSQIGATCLMTEDFGTLQSKRIEDYSVHGVIAMRPVEAGTNIVKTVEVVKMRETKHDDQTRLYRITDEGIVVYPDQNVLALSYPHTNAQSSEM